ncbi:DEAD/DEAH box helicase [bacterium]|nr:DEAD/DEAH box helicase [bacterium]
MQITEGNTVISKNSLYRDYGKGKVLKIKKDMAKVEYSPGLFTQQSNFAHTKIIKLKELEPVASPLELARLNNWGDSENFNLKQMAAKFLTSNKGGQLSNARTELLPHQIFTAHKVVSSPERRYLLADEVGLGKTIEAGMIWQALLQRGQANRTLVICPAGLTVQWQDEMLEKFGEFFEIFNRDFQTINPRIWDLKTCAIASLDTLKREDHKNKLLENRKWDLIIFDEAHRLSARQYGIKLDKTQNFKLAEDLKAHTDALMLLTATPHQGEDNHSRFINLMKLLDEHINFSELIHRDTPLFISDNGKLYKEYILRTPKSSVTDLNGEKVFKGRNTYSLPFKMFKDEAAFYKSVTDYIKTGYAFVEKMDDNTQKLALGFVLTIFQKLAASSTNAIKASLAGRKLRLKDKRDTITKASQQELEIDERYMGEYEERSTYLKHKDEFVQDEIDQLDKLIDMPVDKDIKLIELLKLIDTIFKESEKGDKEKILIFTEYRSTQDYIVGTLCDKYGADSTVIINGDVKVDQRRTNQQKFKNNEKVRFMVSTESGGEGINLQFCHILINYDIPWNPMRIEQRVGRIYRFGQKKVVQIYNFRNENTIEDKIYDYIEKRLKNIAKALSEVTGEPREDIITSMLGQLESEVDYNDIYKKALVNGFVKQTQKEIDNGLEKARKAYEIATHSLFKDISSYSFDDYDEELRSTVNLSDLEEFAKRYLRLNKRTFSKEGSVYSFITPVNLEGHKLKERYQKATFDRESAIENQDLDFLAIGHPFVDAMLYSCGDIEFTGDTALRKIIVPGAKPRKGIQFNFIIRSRVRRDDYEEYMFNMETVFIGNDLKIDKSASVISGRAYGVPADIDTFASLRIDLDGVYEVAKDHIKEKFSDIWDWEEDVELLNVALVNISSE